MLGTSFKKDRGPSSVGGTLMEAYGSSEQGTDHLSWPVATPVSGPPLTFASVDPQEEKS